MAVETDADRAIFVDADDFGVAVTWIEEGGAEWPLSGIFDADHLLLVQPMLEEGQSGANPRLMLRTRDIPAGAAKGNRVVVAGADYFVVELRPDGTGMTEVKLHEDIE